MKILVIEDDQTTRKYLVKGLSSAGHSIDCIGDGREGLSAGLDTRYDILIVDRMVPGLDGLNLVKSLRAASVRTPVLFLTAMSGVDDRVEGLEAGGDDYLVKPFAFSELVARINALVRRPLLPLRRQSCGSATLKWISSLGLPHVPDNSLNFYRESFHCLNY